MLRNKYIMIIVGLMFVFTAIYNIGFFWKRTAKSAFTTETAMPSEKETALSVKTPLASDKTAWKKSPFRIVKDKDFQAAAHTERTGSAIRVDAITVGGEKNHAIVNGRIVGVGDEINGLVVVKISRHSITVKDGKELKEIPIY